MDSLSTTDLIKLKRLVQKITSANKNSESILEELSSAYEDCLSSIDELNQSQNESNRSQDAQLSQLVAETRELMKAFEGYKKLVVKDNDSAKGQL